MDTFLKLMAKTAEWGPPHFKTLGKGLAELRWKSEKVQHRIVGFARGAREYVMVVGCTHKQQVYVPPDALKQSAQRKKDLDLKRASTLEYILPTDR